MRKRPVRKLYPSVLVNVTDPCIYLATPPGFDDYGEDLVKKLEDLDMTFILDQGERADLTTAYSAQKYREWQSHYRRRASLRVYWEFMDAAYFYRTDLEKAHAQDECSFVLVHPVGLYRTKPNIYMSLKCKFMYSQIVDSAQIETVVREWHQNWVKDFGADR